MILFRALEKFSGWWVGVRPKFNVFSWSLIRTEQTEFVLTRNGPGPELEKKFSGWRVADLIFSIRNKSAYFRVKLKRIKFGLYTEPDLTFYFKMKAFNLRLGGFLSPK